MSSVRRELLAVIHGDGDAWPDPIPLHEAGDVPTFPVETLPGWAADYAADVAHEMQVAIDLPAVLALVALSIANTGRHKVAVTNTWHEPLNLYAVVSLPPSAGKSPVVSKMLGAVHAHELAEHDRLIPVIERAQQRKRMADTQRKRAEDKGDHQEAVRFLDEVAAIDVPPLPRYIADDATPEALALLLADNGGRLALISTEGGPFDIMAGRYSERANLDVYLKAWGGDHLRVDRIGRPTTAIAHPALTVGLTVQPSVIAALASKDEFKGRGLTARFMYSCPADFVGYRNLSEPRHGSERLRDRYDDHVMAMLVPDMPDKPTIIALTDQARTMFYGWRQTLEERRRPDGDLRPLAEWSTKLESSVARVAGLYATADRAAFIDHPVMARAISVGNYWLAHAKIVHDLWQADERVVGAKAVLDWAATRKLAEFSVRDVYNAMRSRFATAEMAREPLTVLTDRGWLKPLFDGPLVVGRRGHESPRFAVHPKALACGEVRP